MTEYIWIGTSIQLVTTQPERVRVFMVIFLPEVRVFVLSYT